MCCVLCIIVFCVVCCDSQCSPQAGQQQEVCKCVVEEEVGPQLAQSNPFQGGRATVKILTQLVQKHNWCKCTTGAKTHAGANTQLVQIHNWCKYTTGANTHAAAPRIHTCNEQRARTQCLFDAQCNTKTVAIGWINGYIKQIS